MCRKTAAGFVQHENMNLPDLIYQLHERGPPGLVVSLELASSSQTHAHISTDTAPSGGFSMFVFIKSKADVRGVCACWLLQTTGLGRLLSCASKYSELVISV